MTSGPVMRRVVGPHRAMEAPPPVMLRREFKGLTVADLLQPDVAGRLPGQVRSALHHIERGDLGAAERALPGQFAAVLVGPGHRRGQRQALVYWLTALAIGTAAAAAAMWF